MARNSGPWLLTAVALFLAPAATGRADTAPSPEVVAIGAAYVAKQYCSCLFVTGRSETSCRAEFKPQIDMASVTVDRAGLPATAKVSVALGAAVAEATYSRGYGCVFAR